jgi:hypothetical protein
MFRLTLVGPHGTAGKVFVSVNLANCTCMSSPDISAMLIEIICLVLFSVVNLKAPARLDLPISSTRNMIVFLINCLKEAMPYTVKRVILKSNYPRQLELIKHQVPEMHVCKRKKFCFSYVEMFLMT